ncbi:MAG: hypothetical protein ACF8PN_06000 [Phycisphaerales bacterium]
MRFYLSNDSYPELREAPRGWTRHLIWWRAFLSATRDWRLWALFATGAAVTVAAGLANLALSGLVANAAFVQWVRFVFPFGAAIVWIVLSITWGGDLMRPHLRRVHSTCRIACPHCGHRLTAHLREPGRDAVRCPECGGMSERSLFDEPFDLERTRAALRRASRQVGSFPEESLGDQAPLNR